MKTCAYCGRENQDEATHCRECGTPEWIVPALPPPVPQEVEPVVVEAIDPECDVPPDSEAALCTACLFPNLPEARWCKRCDAPMSSIAMMIMPDAARATGFVYRRAVETRPKLVVVLGIWLHFFSGFLFNALLLLTVLGGGFGGPPGAVVFLLAIIGVAVCGSMLYRVTRNYFTMKIESLETPA